VGTRLQFGVYEVDLASRELRRAGARIAIQPQPLTVLIVLASRPGEVVSRRELRETLWGDHTHVDFERSLNFCIAQLRRALRDHATSPRFVETLPRVGYRFVAPVHRFEPRSPAERGGKAPASPRRWQVGALPVGLVALGAMLWLGGRPSDPRPSPATAGARAPSPAYVKGLFHASRGPAELPVAIGWLERAVEEAPDDSAARVALARTYYRAAEAQVRTGRDVFPRARAVAATAVEREPDNAEARLWYAVARIYGDWDWAGGGEELRRAVALAPRSVAAQRALAAYLAALGDHAGAVSAIESAQRLDPVCLTVTGEHALYLHRARRFTEAAAAWRGILQVHEDAAPHEGLFQLHRASGREGAAATEALQVMALVGVPAATVEGLSRRAPAEVVRDFLRGALQQLDRPGTGTGPERLALLRAALGEPDRALSLLEGACHDRSPGLPQALLDPEFDALRDEARFKGVVECVGLGGPGPRATRSAGLVGRPAGPAS
jgi:DNA-binding winged helix-turn-helix (wHTH) protein/tetratricopeptide (TPR) repeat protein